MDIKHTQAALDRSVNLSREISAHRRPAHVRFEEVEQAKPAQEVQNKNNDDIEKHPVVQHNKNSNSDDTENPSEVSKFFAIKAEEGSQKSEGNDRHHAKVMHERLKNSYVDNDQAAKTDEVLRNIHKFQQKEQQNSHDVAGKAIDLLA